METPPELELDAAQALFAARLLEAAAHHKGPWEFQWGEVKVPATKQFTDTGVLFTGEFPPICYLQRPEGSLMLLCEGIVVGMRSAQEMKHPGDTAFAITWSVLPTRKPVSL